MTRRSGRVREARAVAAARELLELDPGAFDALVRLMDRMSATIDPVVETSIKLNIEIDEAQRLQ